MGEDVSLDDKLVNWEIPPSQGNVSLDEEESTPFVYPPGEDESLAGEMNSFGLSSVPDSVSREIQLNDSTQILGETDLPDLAKDFGRDDDTVLECYRSASSNPRLYQKMMLLGHAGIKLAQEKISKQIKLRKIPIAHLQKRLLHIN